MRSFAALKTTGRRTAGIIMRVTLHDFGRIPYSGQWPRFSTRKFYVDSRSITRNGTRTRHLSTHLSTAVDDATLS